ncbi:MAG TPA: neuraminidase-like domain-containing protein [Terriglobales bacterium]|nr:neuraminidase-like domain-containing protein [Terriglobales bacterium]
MTIVLSGTILSSTPPTPPGPPAAAPTLVTMDALHRGAARPIYLQRGSDGSRLSQPLTATLDDTGRFTLQLADGWIYDGDVREGDPGATLSVLAAFARGEAGLLPVLRPVHGDPVRADRALYFADEATQVVDAEWRRAPAPPGPGAERLVLEAVRRRGVSGAADRLWRRAIGRLLVNDGGPAAPGLGCRVQLWAVPGNLDASVPDSRIALEESLTDADGLFALPYPWLLDRTAAHPGATRLFARVSGPGSGAALLEPEWQAPQWQVDALAEPDDPLGRPRETLHDLAVSPRVPDTSPRVLDGGALAAPWPAELELGAEQSARLAAHLAARGLDSLRRIADAGGVPDVAGMDADADADALDRAARRLERHAALFAVFPPEQDPARHFALAAGLGVDGAPPTLGQLAAMGPTRVVGQGAAALGDFKAAQLHHVANARARLLDVAVMGAQIDAETRDLFRDNTGIAGHLFSKCGCDDCRSAMSPNAYLADLLIYTSWRLGKLDGTRVTPSVLQADFHQPFASLPVSCGAMNEELLQVRLAIETLRHFIGTPADPAALDRAIAAHEQRVYAALLRGLGLDALELRMAVAEFDAAKPDRLRRLAERLGLQSLDLGETRALWHAPADRGEEALQKTFGYRPARRPTSFDVPPAMRLEQARLAAQAAAWLALDHPAEARAAYRLPGPTWVPVMPLLDPDLVPRDELRYGWNPAHPTTTAWRDRRKWIDDALVAIAAERAAITVPGPLTQEEASFEAALARALDATPDPEPLYQWLATRAKRLGIGGDDAAMWKAYKDGAPDAEAKYFIPPDAYRVFQSLQEAIYAKRPADIRAAQAAKRTLWINVWEASGRRATLDRLAWLDGKLRPIFNGFKALDASLPDYAGMATLLDAFLPLLKALDLKALDDAVPAQKTLKDALGRLIPGRWASAAAFVQALLDRGRLEREAALRLLDLRAKSALGALSMTDDDWRDFDAIWVQRRKETEAAGYRAWAAQDYDRGDPKFLGLAPDSRHFQPPLTAYAVPRWLGNDDRRGAYLQAYRRRSRPPLVEPDLLVASDFAVRDPAKSRAYELWRTRNTEVQGLLGAWAAKPRPATDDDFDRDFVAAGLAIAVADVADLAAQAERGLIEDARLARLGLDERAFTELFRIRALARATARALEADDWLRLFRILAAVQKRRDAWPKWRGEEAEAGLALDPRVFVPAGPPPLVFPPVSGAPTLPEWLGDADLRADWLDLLESRTQQRGDVGASHRAFLLKVDEAALTEFRDALLPVVVAGRTDHHGRDLESQDADAQTRWLSERLLMDLKLTSCARTTRIGQALESLQTLVRSTYEGVGSSVVVLQDGLKYRFFGMNYAQDWKWMSSYALWRSALFMFIYPENLLLPVLTPRDAQSGPFRELVESLANRPISAGDACEAAARHAEYWEDVQNLDLQATCEAQGALPTEAACNGRATLITTSYVYHFGVARSARAYWSAREKSEGPDTPMWAPVPSQLPVRQVIAAVPYRHPDGTRYLALFLRVEDKGVQKLGVTRFDRDRHPSGRDAWTGEVTLLDDLPKSYAKDIGRAAQVLVADPETDAVPAVVVLRGRDGAVFARPLDRDLTGWEGPDWDRWQVQFKLADGTPSEVVELLYARVGAGTGHPFLNLLYRSELDPAHGPRTRRMRHIEGVLDRAEGPRLTPCGVARYIYDRRGVPNVVRDGEQLSAVRIGRRRVFLVGTLNGAWESATLLNFDDNPYVGGLGYPNLETYDVGGHRMLGGLTTLTAFREPVVFVRNSTDLESIQDGNGRTPGIMQPGVFTGMVGKIGWTWTSNVSDAGVTLDRRWRVVPQLGARIPVTADLDEQQLRERRTALETAYNHVRGTQPYAQGYLDEAYFQVPIHLALQLQRSGVFDAALKWFRTVLDWQGEGRDRFIAYKLVLDGKTPAGFDRGGTWLDDLNPHGVAERRKGTYARFVLISLARLLLDYADAEFTRETPESLPKAGDLYELALAVLRSPELLERKAGCLDLVGDLRMEIDDAKQEIRHENLVRGVAALGDAGLIGLVVPKIRAALGEAGRSWDERLLAAETILAANRPAAAPLRMQDLLQREEALHGRAQLAVAAAVPDLRARQARAGRAYRGAITRLTGVGAETLDTRVTDVAGLPRFEWMRRLPDPAAPAPPLGLSFVRLVDREDVIGEEFRERVAFDALAPSREALEHRGLARNPLEALGIAFMIPAGGGGGGGERPPRLLLSFCIVPNPVLKGLKLRADLNLFKLRNCRTIAGFERQMDVYGAPTDPESGLPVATADGTLVSPGGVRLQSTPYRYGVLVARAQRLAALANQFEQSMLQALEKRDAELYNRLRAQQDLKLQKATLKIRELEVKDAGEAVQQADASVERLNLVGEHLTRLLAEPVSRIEQAQMSMIALGGTMKIVAAMLNRFAKGTAAVAQSGMGKEAVAAGASAAMIATGVFEAIAIGADTSAQILGLVASYERRTEGWIHQKNLNAVDVRIAQSQSRQALLRQSIKERELDIANLHIDHAQAGLDFLRTKFTGAELYYWMSGVLQGVYRSLLQQATAMAMLAEQQLSFDRQQSLAYIQDDYWVMTPQDGQGLDARAPDRKGLTGSARLIRDLETMDAFAFAQDHRPLQLARTLSLASLAPAEFQRFRETGMLWFDTGERTFDQDFPGHYMRRIHRVRVTLVALIPPAQGVRAALYNVGPSRVVAPGLAGMETKTLPASHDMIAFSAPAGATGLFELNAPSDLRLPFEGVGVDTSWLFELSRAANPFDFASIADVLVTLEYTAQYSADYREIVIATRLPRRYRMEKGISFRHQLADVWYELLNPATADGPVRVGFDLAAQDFPSNLDRLQMEHVLFYVSRRPGSKIDVSGQRILLARRDAASEGTPTLSNGDLNADGVISTRQPNGMAWLNNVVGDGGSPVGRWTVEVPERLVRDLRRGEIEDVFLSVAFRGQPQAWPSLARTSSLWG